LIVYLNYTAKISFKKEDEMMTPGIWLMIGGIIAVVISHPFKGRIGKVICGIGLFAIWVGADLHKYPN
jgi:hypothetical protein